MTLIDLPRHVSADCYEDAALEMTSRLRRVPGILGVHRIGSVTSPGISDLDMLALFDGRMAFRGDPRQEMIPAHRYLFVHRLYGIAASDFSEAAAMSFFHNYRHCWGAMLPPPVSLFAESEVGQLKRQLAVEYMLRICIGLVIQLTYGVLKVRTLFLHAKSLLYDCEFLGGASCDLHSAIQRLVTRRDTWFTTPASAPELRRDVVCLRDALLKEMQAVMDTEPFYLPITHPGPMKLARHILLRPGPRLAVRCRGVRFPGALARISGAYVRLLDRLHQFEIFLPCTEEVQPPVIRHAFALRRRLAAGNRRNRPGFMPLSMGLDFP